MSLTPLNRVKPFSNIFFTDRSKVDHLCYFYLVFAMLSRLFIAALRSPAGKGLTSWLSFVMFKVGKVWCLIVSIPDLFPFLTFIHVITYA